MNVNEMIRTLHPKLLDDLPADEPAAIGSRRDLRRLNTLMGHAAIIARCLKNIFPHEPPSRILEIGAGDGQLLLRVARRLHSSRWINSQRSHHPESATQFPPLSEGEREGASTTTTVSNPPLTSAAALVDVLFIDLQNLLVLTPKSNSPF